MRSALLVGCLFLLAQGSISCAVPLGKQRPQANGKGTGFITVQSEPPGLAVLLDGQPAGKTPLAKVELSTGPHDVRVGWPCHEEIWDRFEVLPGETRTIELAPAVAEVELSVKLRGGQKGFPRAEALVDGKPVGEVPGNFKVPLCSRELEVRHPRAAPFKQQLKLVARQPNKVALTLAPRDGSLPGFLTVRSEPPGRRVLADGERIGFTPMVKQELVPGEYEIRVEGLCHRPAQERVRVEPDHEREVSFTLQALEAEYEVTARSGQGEELLAEVLVGKEPVGSTPGRFKVPLCTGIEVRHPVHGSYWKWIYQASGQVEKLEVVLEGGAGKSLGQPGDHAEYMPPEVMVKRRIAGTDPRYPVAARKAGLEATLNCKILITPEGSVEEVFWLKSDPAFDPEVARALSTWRFSPHLVDGKAVSTYTVYKFVFKLE